MASPVDTDLNDDGYVSFSNDCNGCCNISYGEGK